MRKCYKYLIVVATCVALLACSVISVGASDSFNQNFYANASDVVGGNFEAYVDGDYYTWPIDIVGVGKSPQGIIAMNLKAENINDDNISAFNYSRMVSLIFEPVDGFLDDVEFYENPIITFSLGQRSAFSSELSSLKSCRVVLRDSTTNGYAQITASSPSVTSSDLQFTHVTFTGEDLQGFKSVTEIVFTWEYEHDFSFVDYTAGVCFYPYVEISYDQMDDKYLTEGWIPKPEKPVGSDSVGDLGSIEEELQQGSQEGINAGMDMITGLGDSLTGFQKGFAFFMSFSDELLGKVTWMSSVLTIGLALGIVAFLLNIVGSVASKVSRDERRAEADKRRAERDAQREKQNKR